MIRLSYTQKTIAEAVLSNGMKIAEVAKDWGVSKTTVRRYMDLYSDESLQPKVDQTIENAYLIHIELHVGNDTRHLHRLVYAENEGDAKYLMEAEKVDYRGNEDPSYQLQVKSGPFKLTENLSLLEEY
jgi:uncharacterized protein YjcR